MINFNGNFTLHIRKLTTKQDFTSFFVNLPYNADKRHAFAIDILKKSGQYHFYETYDLTDYLPIVIDYTNIKTSFIIENDIHFSDFLKKAKYNNE